MGEVVTAGAVNRAVEDRPGREAVVARVKGDLVVEGVLNDVGERLRGGVGAIVEGIGGQGELLANGIEAVGGAEARSTPRFKMWK